MPNCITANLQNKGSDILTNQDILEIAMKQSAIDLNCRPEDFLKPQNQIVLSASHPKARKYLSLPFSCNLVSYGSNIVASVCEELQKPVLSYINRFSPERCFETPQLHLLNAILQPFDLQVCFMAEYFLPDINALQIPSCEYETKLMFPKDFSALYTPEWSNALCEKRKELDVLAFGAFDKGKLIGLAGCSADCENMWQIGIDVLPDYRRRGVASTLTGLLTKEILKADKVPFYCAAWSNIRSVRNAIKCGFRPAWVELTAKPVDFLKELTQNDIGF